jgi:Mg2+/Co2+ transporter CorC
MIEDPIAVSIKTLEQNNHGEPKKFDELLENMINGKSGEFYIENARRLLPKVIRVSINEIKKIFCFLKAQNKNIKINYLKF